MRRWLSIAVLGLLSCLAPVGCQSKEKSEVEIETNDTKHEIEWETTDKDPDD